MAGCAGSQVSQVRGVIDLHALHAWQRLVAKLFNATPGDYLVAKAT